MTEQTHTEAGELLARTCRHYLESALQWYPVFEDGRGPNDLTKAETLDLMVKRMVKDLAATRPATSEAVRSFLLKVITMQGTDADIIKEARALYAAPPPSPDPVAVKALENARSSFEYHKSFGSCEQSCNKAIIAIDIALAQIRSKKK